MPRWLCANEGDPLSVSCYPDHSCVKAVSLMHIVNKHIGISLGWMSCELLASSQNQCLSSWRHCFTTHHYMPSTQLLSAPCGKVSESRWRVTSNGGIHKHATSTFLFEHRALQRFVSQAYTTLVWMHFELWSDEPKLSSLLDQDNYHYHRRVLRDYLFSGPLLFMQYVIWLTFIW